MTDEYGIGSGNASLAEHKLNGEVEHVVYESEDASYTVFRLRDPQGAVHTAGGSLLSLETGVVKFYGHSLGEADYAYFQAIFDSVSLYDSDVKLVFYYKPHVKPGEDSVTSLSDQRAKNTMATRVAKLLAEYGNTLDNENHGRNLMHKLMIEGRLEVRLLKGE